MGKNMKVKSLELVLPECGYGETMSVRFYNLLVYRGGGRVSQILAFEALPFNSGQHPGS